jgi:peptidyl-prolyl cis-trans isomerase B (cyclophilin B)
MKKILSLTLVILLAMVIIPTIAHSSKKEKRSVVLLETNAGNIRIALSDLTPIHRDNFLTLASKGYYDGILFHRVIKDFMIQAGDPDSKDAPQGKKLGEGGPGYDLPAEIVFPYLYHVRGMVAAARESDDVNPTFRSSGSQFYIVWGKKMRPGSLQKAISYLRERGIELDRFMINDYQMLGGTPHLDGAYTIFGEVIEGLDIVKYIQAQPTDSCDRPIEDIVIKHATIEHISEDARVKFNNISF